MRITPALVRPFLGGSGCIFTLHRVVSEKDRSPLPANRALEVTPEDLRSTLSYVRSLGLEVISLDALPGRLTNPRGPRFACFTFDDGYRDNATVALPIFREFGMPFAVNVTNGFIEGNVSVWWYFLEQALIRPLRFTWQGVEHRFDAATERERDCALEKIGALIRSLGLQREELLRTIGEAAGIDPCGLTRALCMDWKELHEFAADPLVTIGAHTAGHHSLNRLSEAEIASEVTAAHRELTTRLGREVRHFAYPFGGPNAVDEREFALVKQGGFSTMLTTRAGNLTPAHLAQIDRLPRLTISGNYPVLKVLRLAESGLAAWLEQRRGRAR